MRIGISLRSSARAVGAVLFCATLAAGLGTGPIASPAAAETAEQAGERLMREEHIGSLKLRMPEAEIPTIIRAQPLRSREVHEAADGMYRQRWNYRRLGLQLTMAREKPTGPRHLDAISCKKGCALRTARGIGIGSSEADVRKAYAAEINPESSKDGVIVAGTVYGGIIFNLVDGKVTAIFLGAAAE